MSSSWEPLLHGSERDRALEIARVLAEALHELPPMNRPGLMGRTGCALFLAQAEAHGLGDDLGALAILEQGLGELAAGYCDAGLWTGAAGYRWMLSQFVTGDAALELISRLDHAIRGWLECPSLKDYDLHSGLAGIILAYAGDMGCGNEIIECIVDRFEKMELLHLKRPSKLGCAHGIAGVLAALACCYTHGHARSRILPMMLNLARTLEHVDVADQRVGWCRGDSGVAIAMLSAARALGCDDLATKAVAVALKPFTRVDSRWPTEPALCHGAAGLAHLYNRMYQATRDGQLGEVAWSWLHKIVDMGTPSGPLWNLDVSLRVGAAGVGLVLLGGSTSNVPTWDRILGADIA